MHAKQQQSTVAGGDHLWGFLNPLQSGGRLIEFGKLKTRYAIGRNRSTGVNDIVLVGAKISNFHCIIEWDGDATSKTVVTVTDLSSNGTFINGERIGRGTSKILRDRDIVAFGTPSVQLMTGGIVSDPRFIYRHIVAATPVRGLLSTYEVHSELGKGGFGTVKKALHKSEGAWYAVKMIPANNLWKKPRSASRKDCSELELVYEFTREIHVLESLQHKNICQLKEVFIEDVGMNLVLEWVSGGDLLDYIFEKKGLSEAEARYLTSQICDAVSYVHRQGVVHRDLKPENVLLTSDDPPNIKVADFGLAKVFNCGSKLRTRCGTPIYTAPEVTKPHPKGVGYDLLIDSWSVGVMVFYMLTMYMPFLEDDNGEPVSQQHIEWSILCKHHVSDDVKDFIRRLLEYDPRRRMAISGALMHRWLGYQPQNHTQTGDESLDGLTAQKGADTSDNSCSRT